MTGGGDGDPSGKRWGWWAAGRRGKEEGPTRLKEDPHSGDKEDGMGLMTARAGDRK